MGEANGVGNRCVLQNFRAGAKGSLGPSEKPPEPTQLKRGKEGKMAFISKERESTGEDSTIPPSFMTYHDEVGLYAWF